MEVTNCVKCGKLFTKLVLPICEECQEKEEQLFQATRKYIEDNPSCSVNEVTREVGVTVRKIMKYLREGRLEVSQGMVSEGFLKCEKCGISIRRGHYCDSCVINLNNEVSDIYEDDRNKGPKMHTKSK